MTSQEPVDERPWPYWRGRWPDFMRLMAVHVASASALSLLEILAVGGWAEGLWVLLAPLAAGAMSCAMMPINGANWEWNFRPRNLEVFRRRVYAFQVFWGVLVIWMIPVGLIAALAILWWRRLPATPIA